MPRISALSVGIIAMLVLGGGAATISVASTLEPSCDTFGAPGKATALVDVADGESGQPPVVDFPQPLVTAGTERITAREGTGDPAGEGSAVDFQAAAYLGSGGQFLTATSFVDGETIRRVVSSENTDFFGQALACVKTGERLVLTDTIEAVFGPIPEDDIVQNDSTAVIVIDVAQVYPASAEGVRQGLRNGVPKVVQHPDGRHGVSIPMGAPPEELVVHTTIRGEGPVVSDGDRVVAHYTGVVWETKQTFSSSFDQEAPLSLDLLDGSVEGATAGVISGIYEGLVGQTIGSQVVLVVPPSSGYPEGGQPNGVPDGSTLVYVFDILGVE